MNCPVCNGDVLEIDVKCAHCGAPLGATGAHRMLGQVMLGQYELVDVLGQGGMSVVFKGKHKLTDQEVALKILPPELAAHSQVKSRFLEEAKALAALDHPNIVHLYNFGQENGYFVLAMQYVQGRTWERIILENKRMDWRASCKVAIEVLRALEYAHGRGVIHRDMKPSNVLVRAHDAMATVMDFGIAKMTTSTKLTATGQTMGTVRYMSPEQVRGQEVDLRTDLYSLGATLFESLTGDTPFDGSTHFEIMTKHLSEVPKRPSSMGIEVPQIVEDALMRSLAKRPDDRFTDAREMRKILEDALRAEGDGGVIDTQSLNREVLGVRPPVHTPQATPKIATATAGGSLADELEPGTAGLPLKKRSMVPWLVLGVLVLGGGSAAALMMMNRGGKPKLALEMPGVTVTAEGTFGDQLVGTTGMVPPAELARHYAGALAAYRQAASVGKKPFDVADPVQELIAVPRAALCKPASELRSNYLDAAVPHTCETATFATVQGDKRRLLVIDDPALMPRALLRGVAYSACLFASMDEAESDGVLAICQLSKQQISEAAHD